MSAPSQKMRPPVGCQKPADEVEDRGLAGAVGADEAVEAAFRHRQVQVRKGRQPPEAHVQVFRPEQSHGNLMVPRRRAPRWRPRGAAGGPARPRKIPGGP